MFSIFRGTGGKGMIQIAPVSLGSDPEAFLQLNGLIVGSERYVPEEGLQSYTMGPKVVRDGVQIELSLRPSRRREMLGADISSAFNTLWQRINGVEGVKTCFDPVVDITETELNSLSDKSRQFGCAESFNLYGLPGPEADASKYLKRSAGGHVHMGLQYPIFSTVSDKDERKRLIALMDIIVGNTSVLIDRDPWAAERRKNYGKAGEYRLPVHGAEYRTLSNFWLTSYPLFSLVMGLTKLAVSVLHTDLQDGTGFEKELTDKVDFDTMIKAIQENDLLLAHKTWNVVAGFIDKHGHGLGDECGLNNGLLKSFELFLKGVQQNGLKYWFPEDPMEHWRRGKQQSFESFLRDEVRA